jgi:hypothetical protein
LVREIAGELSLSFELVEKILAELEANQYFLVRNEQGQ